MTDEHLPSVEKVKSEDLTLKTSALTLKTLQIRYAYTSTITCEVHMRLIPLGLALFLTSTVLAQSGVKVEVDDLTDNRVTGEMLSGSLELRVKLTGNGLDKATAARILIKEAKDDRGTSLIGKSQDPPDFQGREYNSGMLSVSVASPARAASSVKMKGTVELFVPSRDPSSNIKIDKALTKLDTPLSSSALKAAKIEITPLSPARHAAMREERKITPEKIAQIKEEGKKRGVPEKEIEMMIGLAQALSEMDSAPREGTIILSAKKSTFDRIYRIDVLGPDGQPIDFPERSTSSMGDDSLMTLVPREPPPPNAALQVTLLTDKSKMSFPFELTLPLP